MLTMLTGFLTILLNVKRFSENTAVCMICGGYMYLTQPKVKFECY